MSKKIIPLTPEQAKLTFGPQDKNIREICDRFGVNIHYNDRDLTFSGRKSDVSKAVDAFKSLTASSNDRKVVKPKTRGQESYMRQVRSHDITFCTGPAGTGKTYLAVAVAVEEIRKGTLKKLILVRPAVEAGESLGYLPGDINEKVDPFLRPLLDAVGDIAGKDFEVEIAPLAYMRGRTLNNAFVILDEAQNATLSQLKMFLTRLGEKSKMVVTGDVTQTDLHRDQSGLSETIDRLSHIREISIVRLDSDDIVRHPLVQKIDQHL